MRESYGKAGAAPESGPKIEKPKVTEDKIQDALNSLQTRHEDALDALSALLGDGEEREQLNVLRAIEEKTRGTKNQNQQFDKARDLLLEKIESGDLRDLGAVFPWMKGEEQGPTAGKNVYEQNLEIALCGRESAKNIIAQQCRAAIANHTFLRRVFGEHKDAAVLMEAIDMEAKDRVSAQMKKKREGAYCLDFGSTDVYVTLEPSGNVSLPYRVKYIEGLSQGMLRVGAQLKSDFSNVASDKLRSALRQAVKERIDQERAQRRTPEPKAA